MHPCDGKPSMRIHITGYAGSQIGSPQQSRVVGGMDHLARDRDIDREQRPGGRDALRADRHVPAWADVFERGERRHRPREQGEPCQRDVRHGQ